MTNLGTPGGSVGSFRNIQQFLKTNAGAEADFAQRTYADPMAKDAAAITSASGNIPTPAEYTARSGVSGTTPANTPTIQNQAAEQGYKLGTGATPGAYQSFLQNRGQSAGTSRLDAYLYGATPGGAQEDVRNAQQKFGGLLGLVKNQVPYGSTLSPEGVASPTPTTGTVRSKGPAVRKNEGEDGEGPPGKVWSPYSNSWVSPAMLAKQEGLEELRNSNRGRNPRETP
jgi:hypothetical protein